MTVMTVCALPEETVILVDPCAFLLPVAVTTALLDPVVNETDAMFGTDDDQVSGGVGRTFPFASIAVTVSVNLPPDRRYWIAPAGEMTSESSGPAGGGGAVTVMVAVPF